MNKMMGKIMISGMAIEIVSDADDKREVRNITAYESLFMEKLFIGPSIKPGLWEQLS